MIFEQLLIFECWQQATLKTGCIGTHRQPAEVEARARMVKHITYSGCVRCIVWVSVTDSELKWFMLFITSIEGLIIKAHGHSSPNSFKAQGPSQPALLDLSLALVVLVTSTIAIVQNQVHGFHINLSHRKVVAGHTLKTLGNRPLWPAVVSLKQTR
ncbi:hypothetical protein BDN67DRAFT_983729 [Paxillus ammoniavirescens]|nr:hypothetical protein BDN67DRAFT_983729 [Paxillus ammoniavirescens]